MVSKEDKKLLLYILSIIKKRPAMFYSGDDIRELNIFMGGIIYGLSQGKGERNVDSYFSKAHRNFFKYLQKKYNISHNGDLFQEAGLSDLSAEKYISLFEESLEELDIS